MSKGSLPLIACLLFFLGCRSTILEDPALIISYSIAQPAHVLLTVENSYNTLVATPVDEDQAPGFHSATINADGFPEGIYFYTLEFRGIGNNYYFKTTHNMLLLKRI
jgi:hypothetical protein